MKTTAMRQLVAATFLSAAGLAILAPLAHAQLPPGMAASGAAAHHQQQAGDDKKDRAILPNSGVGPYDSPVPGDANKNLVTPLSTEKMTLDETHIDSQISKATSEADQRLSGITLGSGDLKAPDMDEKKTELQTLQDGEMQIRLLKMKQAEATEAKKLWDQLYDGPREHIAATGGDASHGAADGTAGGASWATQASAPAAIQQTSDADALPHMPQLKELLKQTPPVVSSVVGTLPNLHATILVPYIGQMHVQAGNVLPGDIRIVSIDRNGVIASRDGETFPLGYGNSVPTTYVAPAVAATVRNRSGAAGH